MTDTVFNGPGGSSAATILRVTEGSLDHVGHEFTIDRAEQVIGRSPAADVLMDDASISERHAMIVAREGRHFIYDLGSSNGTYVNDERVIQAELRSGDIIRCGDTLLEYQRDVPLRVTVEIPDPVPLALPAPSRAIAIRDPHQAPFAYGSVPPPPLFDPYGHAQFGARATVPPARDEDEVSTKEMIDRLRRVVLFFGPYWRSILLCALLGTAVGAASFFLLPPGRTASFEINLVEQTVENPVERFERRNIQFFRAAQQNFRSIPLIESTLKTLDVDRPEAGLLSSLQARLEFINVSPNTYAGKFVDKDPEYAVLFLRTHLATYLDTEIDKTLKVIRAEGEFLSRQLSDTEKELRRTEEALLAFKKDNIDGLPDQARQYYDLLFELQRREIDIEREVGRLSSQVELDRKKLQEEKPLVDARRMETRPYQTAIIETTRQLAELRGQGLGEDHPDIRRLAAQEQELKRLASKHVEIDVEQRSNPVYANIRDSLRELEVASRTARSDRVRIQKELDRVKGVVDKLPQLEAEYAELTRSYDATKSLHTRIFNQLKTTELQLELERASAKARYDIITPPHLEFTSPLKGLSKRAVILGVAGLFFGLLQAGLRQLKDILAPERRPQPIAIAKR